MKSIFRTLLAITFSLLLVLTPSVAVFADDDSAMEKMENNRPTNTREANSGSENQKGGSEKSDDDDQMIGGGADNQNIDNDNDSDDDDDDDDDDYLNLGGNDNDNLGDDDDDQGLDYEIDTDSDDDDQDLDDDELNLGSDNDGDDNGDGTDSDEGSDPSTPAVNPVTVTVTDFGISHPFEADADGTVRISGLFITFDQGASGSESFVMIVGGRAYPITIHSTGKVYGRLPRGFSIKNGELIIKGASADMDIWFIDHTVVSGMSETPDGDDSYYEPSDTSETSDKPQHRSSEQSAAGYTAATVSAPPSEEPDVPTAEKTTEVIYPSNDSAEDEQVLDAFEEAGEEEGRTLPLATGIALSVGAVSGLGVLLKLKLFAAL